MGWGAADGDADRRGEDQHIRGGIDRRDALVGGVAGIEIRIGIEKRDVPSAAAQRETDRSSDETESGDQRAPRGHHCVIMISVRSTVCDVEASKYGRWIVTRGRFGFGSISAA